MIFLADLAAHFVHSFGHGQAVGRLAIDLDDKVARLDAGFAGGGVIDWRDDFDIAVFRADFDAQAAELAAGAFLQLGEVFGAQIRRVRVKVAEHALDGVLQQGLVVYRFNIRGLDAVHDLGKCTQLFQRQRCLGAGSGRRLSDLLGSKHHG